MTKTIATLLGQNGPGFQLGIKHLEQSSGRPSHDIRITTAVLQGMRDKLHELGLDKDDTTGRELYAVLGARLHGDELRLQKAIGSASGPDDDPIDQVAQAVAKVVGFEQCFALKNVVAKKILKANVPKRTMKVLGYRSTDSMLKHESVVHLFAAAWLVENEQWARRVVQSYAKLQAHDFEVRPLKIEHPTSKRWMELAESVVAIHRHHVMSFKELGAVVLLPLPKKRPPLATMTTTVFALHAVNAIRAASTFMKLHQTKPGFGLTVQNIVLHEPALSTHLLDEPVSWHIIQQYYALAVNSAKTHIFEPVVQAEDLAWHNIEDMLARIEPSLGFWRGTTHLALMEGNEVVSCNLSDALLSHCNRLPFAYRTLHNFRHALRTELTLRYLSHDHLEQSVLGELHLQLATEPARM